MDDTARAQLERLGWHDGRRYSMEGIAERMKARGFDLFPAARDFLERFGMLIAVQNPPYPRGTNVYFHSQPEDVPTDPSWTDVLEHACGTRVFPIGATAYGDYLLFMDEHGRVFGIDLYLNPTYWADNADDLLDIVFGLGGTFWPVEADDRRPIAHKP